MRPSLRDIYRILFSFFGPQGWWPADSPFEVMVGAILTQNTNWTNVEKAIHNLRSAGKLDPGSLLEMRERSLATLIRPAGYYNVKARRLREFLRFFILHYGGSVEKMQRENSFSLRDKLLGVHGIGPETADSIMLYALKKPLFVIDMYTKRILSRHNIADHTEPYEVFQELFHREIDQNVQLYNEYHALLVRLAKEYCRARPRCGGCPLEGA